MFSELAGGATFPADQPSLGQNLLYQNNSVGDLWALNLTSGMWREILPADPNAPWPAPRNQHTAVVLLGGGWSTATGQAAAAGLGCC